MIRPDSLWKKIWDAWILILTVYSAIEIPARLTIGYELPPLMRSLDYAVSLLFFIDLFLNLRTIVYAGGKPISDPATVAGLYIKRWFLIDFVAAIPFDLLIESGVLNSNHLLRLLRLLRLFKLIRLVQFLRRFSSSVAVNPAILRMSFFIFWIMLTAHWLACGWVMIGGVTREEFPSDAMRYLISLYYVFTTMTTVGYGDITPQLDNPVQTLYAIFVLILGAGMYGYVIGNVASLLANIDVARTAFTERIERVNAFMKYQRLPAELQERIRNYYEYIWGSRLGYEESSVVNDLPPSLRMDVSLYINREIIEKVPLFRGAGENLIRDIVFSLGLVVYMPGDVIVRKGDYGETMYFIRRGVAEVVSDDGEQVYATLTEGNFFGEMSLLLREPRTATIRAADYCDLYTLDKKTFDLIIERYPDFLDKINRHVKKIQGELEHMR